TLVLRHVPPARLAGPTTDPHSFRSGSDAIDWWHAGRHADSLRHRRGRSLGRGTTLAAGLRRAAEARSPEADPGEAGSDAPGHRTRPRGILAVGGHGEGPTLE